MCVIVAGRSVLAINGALAFGAGRCTLQPAKMTVLGQYTHIVPCKAASGGFVDRRLLLLMSLYILLSPFQAISSERLRKRSVPHTCRRSAQCYTASVLQYCLMRRQRQRHAGIIIVPYRDLFTNECRVESDDEAQPASRGDLSVFSNCFLCSGWRLAPATYCTLLTRA